MINTTVTIWSKLFSIGMFVTISMTLFLLCNTSNAVAFTSHTASLSAYNHPVDGLDDDTVAAAENNRSLNSIYLLLMADTTPPLRSNGLPAGTLPKGMTQTPIILETNEDATCRYSNTANTNYSSMTDTFSTTGSTNHSSVITGLTDGSNYTYYVRCEDINNSHNTDDFPISFSISNGSGGDYDCECEGAGNCYNIYNDLNEVDFTNLSVGDTIRIHYNTYTGHISLNDSGAEAHPIKICGVPGLNSARPTIQGTTTGAGGVAVIDIGDNSNIQIQGLILTNGRRGIESASWPGSDNIIISNNEIYNNGDNTPSSSNHGGGINIYGDNILIADNSIRDNFSGRSGGIFINGSNNELRGNLIQNNTGYHDHGGGLYINGSNNTIVTRNIIEGNVTGPYDGGGHGGGILTAGSLNTSFSYNIVRNNFAYGAGSGMWIDEASTATIDHELVYHNVSNRYGAGIGVDERYTLDPSHVVITNSTIAYNYSIQDRSYGYNSGNGLMCDTGSTAVVSNTIFYGNKRLTGCSNLVNGRLEEHDLTGCDFSGPAEDFRISTQDNSVPVNPNAINMTYSFSEEDHQESDAVRAGTGNIQGDPLFIDAPNGNFRLQSGSPAIDTGLTTGVSQDLDGNPIPSGSAPDMGVYEFQQGDGDR